MKKTPDIHITTNTQVKCNGTEISGELIDCVLGAHFTTKNEHPEIFLALPPEKIVKCPYCGREFLHQA